MFVSLAVAPFVAGIKACREPRGLIGESWGEEHEEEDVEKRKKKHVDCCWVILMHFHALKAHIKKCFFQ